MEISWVQVCASALAAVSSAILLSTVGVAGTLIGAAVGSVIATVGSAVYSHYLTLSRQRVAAAQAAALARVSRARVSVTGAHSDVHSDKGRAEQEIEQAHAELKQAEDALTETPPKAPWRETLAGLPWKRIAIAAAGIFVAAMIVIVSFELIVGKPVSEITGGTKGHATGTSIPGLGGGSASKPTQTPTPSQSASPTSTPTTDVSPTVGGPAGSSIPSPTSSASQPGLAPTSSAPSPTASATPSSEPTTAAPAPTDAPTTPVGRPGSTPVADPTPSSPTPAG
jgi:hypothetical protein